MKLVAIVRNYSRFLQKGHPAQSLPTPLRLGGPKAREPESPRALRGADEGREPPNSVRAVASTSGLRYVACTATQASPDLPVCLRWLQAPSACTSSAQLLSRHLSRSSCTTAESDDQPCTWARLSTHETAAGGLCFRRVSWTLLVAAPEARRGPTPDAVRAERGVTRLPLLEPSTSVAARRRIEAPEGATATFPLQTKAFGIVCTG